MKVLLQPALNDINIDAGQLNSQRQLAISISAVSSNINRTVPLNLCLILDRSGSMKGRPIETVKQAANRIVDRLTYGDRLSIVVFDHRAKVLIPNQLVEDPEAIKAQINKLKADGGTAIDEGMKLGIEELGKGKKEAISQAFLLTDGENEHGDDRRCLNFAQLAADYNLTLNTLGFGDHWNQDILEKIADVAGGKLSYIEEANRVEEEFGQLFSSIQSIGLTNAYLLFSLGANVRLAELKPIAQVSPDTVELSSTQEANGQLAVRLGDLSKDISRVVLANIYVGKLLQGKQEIAQLQVRYDDPFQNKSGLLSDIITVEANIASNYQPQINHQVQTNILALAKYRQTQMAEAKLLQGDRSGAATLLQTAAKTALQMGDKNAATVLQTSATRLQAGEELSESDRKKTRIVSKTVLQ